MRATTEQLAHAWYNALTAENNTEKRSEISDKFLQYVYRGGDMKNLSEIVRHMQQLERENSHIDSVTLTSAHPLSDEQQKDILKKIFGERTMRVTTATDESLIGGVQVETQNTRYDMTIKSHLKQLENALTQ